MRTSWRSEVPQLGLIAVLFCWSVVLWPTSPDRIPVHFDLYGNADRWAGRLEGLFSVPVLCVAVYALLRFLPRFDPARANYASFAAAYTTIRFSVLIMLALVDLVILLPLAGVAVSQAALIRLIVGCLLMVIGGVMGKIRPNWFVGIRTPWTLSSKESWVKTHRLGGWVFLGAGWVFILSLALPPGSGFAVAFGALGVGLVWTVLYSYLVWRNDPVRYPAIRSRPARE